MGPRATKRCKSKARSGCGSFPSALLVTFFVAISVATGALAQGFTTFLGGPGPKTIPEELFSSLPIVTIPGSASNLESGKRKLRCTATLIGAKVLLTAAHCLSKVTETVTVYRSRAKADADRVATAVCTQHPYYSSPQPNQTADYALCLLKKAVPASEARYEWISLSEPLLISASRLYLVGFGCRDIKNRSVPIIGDSIRLAFGPADIVRLGLRFADARQHDNMITVLNSGLGSYLCDGDSGGAGVLSLTAGAQADNQGSGARRVVVGVNSAVVARDYDISLVAGIGTQDFAEFLVSWSTANGNPAICRLEQRATSDLKSCRDLQ